MPKKTSQPEVEKEISDDEADQIETPPVQEPPKKYAKGKGKERTPAQKEAFAKALSILKEKREAKAKDEKDRYEKASQEEKARIEKEKYEKAKNHKKRLPPAPSYVTTSDLEKFKNDLLNAIPKYEAPKPVETPKPVKKEPVEAPVEPVVAPKRKVEPVATKPLTGHDLIDKLFFT